LDVQKLRLLAEPVGAPADRVVECDLLVAGGGMGGCAAALVGARTGLRVLLTEETDWLGGQMTSQGVSALDEHRGAEESGCTRSYYELRRLIREYYRREGQLTPEAAGDPRLNPGEGWVSYLCFEPKAGLWALEQLLEPHARAGRLSVLLRHRAVRVVKEGEQIRSVLFRNLDGEERTEARARFVLDATELGDLLPLAGVEYVTGAESREDTGEPNARPDAAAWCQQSFTYPFALELRPGPEQPIPEPEGYARNRERQPYTLRHLYYDERGWVAYRMFETGPRAAGPFWTYRRLIAAGQFRDGRPDVAMINWPGNDFRHGAIVDVAPETALEHLRQAKLLSLGFCRWLQTECPRDDGGTGYPEMRLRAEVMGTADGLSKYPYIRESRRIVPAGPRILEQAIAAGGEGGARAEYFPRSLGVGHYAIDIHPAEGEEKIPPARTRPFQIPFDVFLPRGAANLLPACKNLGTTHITNGAYRLHPIEWNIGEAAAEIAAACIRSGRAPGELDAAEVRAIQARLAGNGVPLHWFTDVPPDHPLFEAAQVVAGWGLWTGDAESLELGPEGPVHPGDREQLAAAISGPAAWCREAVAPLVGEPFADRGEFVRAVYEAARG
ncbi:MAG TPA: FAD-dependent oxidoreductase, partial [Armatimonadota bacterium]|nr:FAD-dependent oxidoreductase [Armatimonadota bacterium]